MALGGERPLNLAVESGWRVTVLLHAPEGSWPAAGGLTVVLA
jgi:hypothetical protein